MAPAKRLFTPKFMSDIAEAKTLPSSLCFLEAFAARHYERITQDEYYRHVFSHLTGTFHKQDETEGDISLLKQHDPFAYSVLDCARKMGPIQGNVGFGIISPCSFWETSTEYQYPDAQSFEQIFKAYDQQDVENVKSRIDGMKQEQVPYALRILAMQALVDRRPKILEFCFERGGFEYEPNFVSRADSLDRDKHPETWKVLEKSDFRKLHPYRQHPAFAFDNGGSHPVNW